jgi:hypothetical protein
MISQRCTGVMRGRRPERGRSCNPLIPLAENRLRQRATVDVE